MYNVVHKLMVVLDDIEHLLSKEYKHPNRKKLFFDYFRIRIKASLNRWLHFKKEHFLSYTVTVPDYDVFLAEFRQIFVHHVYYSETKAKAPRIIDCGGNIGISTLYWKYLFPDSQILVFEPSSEVVEILKENIRLNNLSNTEVVEAAVSDTEGEADIYIRGSNAEGNTLSKNIWESTPTKAQIFYRVKTVKLSNYIHQEVDIVKLDIEGNEGVVLKELTDADKFKLVKECIIEYHYYPTERDNDLENILILFKRNGFESQFYFEERSSTQQLDLIKGGSYAVGIRSVPLRDILAR